jgi:glycosyltransferase involved in cell wall biosynthesis
VGVPDTVKIAIVGPAHPYKGGTAQHTTTLAHRLSAVGHDTVLVSWRAQYPRFLYPGQLTVAEPEVALYPGMERPLAWYRPDGWWLTGRRLARQGCDVVVLSVVTPVQAPAYLALARAARSGGCTVVALCHNVQPHENRGADEPLMRALLRRVDAVVVHSAAEASRAEALTSAPVQVATLPPHLPPPGRAPTRVTGAASPEVPAGLEILAEAAATAAAAGTGPAGPRHRLLFFGIVRPYKGLDILLRALAETGQQISLTVAGEIWSGRDDLLRLISDLGLQDRVTMPGTYVPTADVPGLFAGADALVLPYRSATASQNALIAFQFGVPVIASRAGAIADAVQDGVNGILCAPGDAVDLARAIRALYAPGALERLRAGVLPPVPGPLWDVYLAALGKAISAGQYRNGEDRLRRVSPAAAPPSERPLSAGAVLGRGCGAVPRRSGGTVLVRGCGTVRDLGRGTRLSRDGGAVLGRRRRAIASHATGRVPTAAA